MGNCCKGSALSPSSIEGEQQLSQRLFCLQVNDQQNQQAASSYCKTLQELDHQNISPLAMFSLKDNKISLNTKINGAEQNMTKFLEDYKDKTPQIDQIQSILQQLCKGLIYLHEKGITHGDLTPKNIEIKLSDNQVVIKNMSLPKKIAFPISKQDESMMEFYSPQKQKDEELNPQDDVFSLGAIAFVLYGGKLKRKDERPSNCTQIIYSTLLNMMKDSSQSRPSIKELLKNLESQNSLPNPISPEQNSQNVKHEEKNKKNIEVKAAIINDEDDVATIDQNQNKPQNNQEEKALTRVQSPLSTEKKIKGSIEPIKQEEKKNNNYQPDFAIHKPQQNNQQSNIQVKAADKPEQEHKDEFDPMKIIQLRADGIKKEKVKIMGHTGKITSLLYDQTNKLVLTGGLDGIVNIYTINEDKNIGEYGLKLKKEISDFEYGISDMVLVADNLYISQFNSNISVYSISKLTKVDTISCSLTNEETIKSFKISKDMSQLLTLTQAGKVFLFNLNKFVAKDKQKVEGFNEATSINLFQSNVLVGTDQGALLIYKTNNLITPVKEVSLCKKPISSISVENTLCGFSSEDGTVHLINKEFELVQSLNPHLDNVSCVYITPENKNIVTAGWDGVIRIYLKGSSDKYSLETSFTQSTSWVTNSIFLPKDKLLMTSGGVSLSLFQQ